MGLRPDPEAIRKRAYELFRARGCADGYAEEDWLQAERELLNDLDPAVTPSPTRAVDESVKESFPASDPPASRLPDEPPVNAGEKWTAAVEAAKRGEAEVTPFANPHESSTSGKKASGSAAQKQGAQVKQPESQPTNPLGTKPQSPVPPAQQGASKSKGQRRPGRTH